VDTSEASLGDKLRLDPMNPRKSPGRVVTIRHSALAPPIRFASPARYRKLRARIADAARQHGRIPETIAAQRPTPGFRPLAHEWLF
jgi:hypothetical protein